MLLAAEVILAAEVMAAEADRADPYIETTATTQALLFALAGFRIEGGEGLTSYWPLRPDLRR
jgi:hypothetical protein